MRNKTSSSEPPTAGTTTNLLAPAIVTFAERASKLADELSEAGSLDPATGQVALDEKRLLRALRRAQADDWADSCGAELIALAKEGFAVPTAVKKSAPKPALPWYLFTQAARADSGPALLALPALGISLGASPESVRARLTEEYANVPSGLLTLESLRQLIQRGNTASACSTPGSVHTIFGTARLELKPDLPPQPEPARPPAPLPAPGWEPLKAKADEAARCLQSGDWRTEWWGWGLCLDHGCAEKVADVLQIATTLLASGIAALALTGPLAIALAATAAAGFLLGVNIRAVNGPKGACIQGCWLTGPLPWAKRW